MDGFIGEIRIFGFNYPPQDWAACNGASFSQFQYQALFAVIGQTYGSAGQGMFNVPNLQGMALMGAGAGPGLTTRTLAQSAGEVAVALTQSTMPAHSHTLQAWEVAEPFTGLQASPQNTAFVSRLVQPVGTGSFNTAPAFSDTASANAAMAPVTVGPSGAGAAHSNMQPYLTMNFCIALVGTYPVRPS